MAGDGRCFDLDHKHTIAAIRAMTNGVRLGDEMNEAIERLEKLQPADVRQLCERMTERRAA